MFLDFGRKPAYPTKANADSGRKCKLYTKMPQSHWPWDLLAVKQDCYILLIHCAVWCKICVHQSFTTFQWLTAKLHRVGFLPGLIFQPFRKLIYPPPHLSDHPSQPVMLPCFPQMIASCCIRHTTHPQSGWIWANLPFYSCHLSSLHCFFSCYSM